MSTITDRGPTSAKRVVIVGGGFAGLYAARTLTNQEVSVTLVDRKNHHTFQPLLYQVAAGVLSPGEIAAPLRHVFRKARNVEVLLSEVVGFKLDDRRVLLRDGAEIPYDFLIVAAGARHSYFGHQDWEQAAPGLKTIEDAIDIRSRILLAFESAERQQFLTGSHEPLNFAIVGGGPTGVEMAGMIADIARRVAAKEYKAIDTGKSRVILLEGSSHVLGVYPENLSTKAKIQLEQMGVEVLLNNLVEDVEPNRICVQETWIPAQVIVWATGVAASPLGRAMGVQADSFGRVHVEPDLSLPGRPEVFVVGDMANLKDANGIDVPGLGAAAQQMGCAAAISLLSDLRGQPRIPFTYKDKGTMATIGKHRAVAKLGRIELTGFPAWILWGAVHVLLLVGYRSRFWVLREWIWAYVSNQLSARLITGSDESHQIRL